MPLEWAGLSPEVLLSVDRGGAEPLRAQLERQVREAIRTGRLDVGERLPSSRELAATLGLSRGLVQDCYAQLQAEGYLVTRVGSATRVAAGACRQPAAAPAPPAPAPTLIADFRSGVPDLRSFPMADWMWALREAGRAVPTAGLDYGDPRGTVRLREVLAGYLRRVRAAAADADRLVVCSGYQQGLDLVLRALADGGARIVAYEDPGSPETAGSAAARAGLAAVPVPVDEAGVDVDALAATGADAVVVTPAHQSPTGVVLAPERRLALLDWATRTGGTVIEDDYDAEFRYDRDPVGALQGLAPDRVVAIGTVSKSLVPALRLGWLLCPASIADRIVAHKHLSDRGSPALDQLALATMIESGRYDRHLRRMRTRYAARRDVLVGALATHTPGVRLTGLAAGFHAVAHLPDDVDETAVVTAARARRVGLYGMSAHRSSHATVPPRLVLGFGNLSSDDVSAGIAAVADLLTAT
ncbi:PLP-dependent aminotransferase family protein [Actinocatenispora sera]|uniref:MocR-like pyridoxine biosynthesis transcription factor PdxR n=1 Tax=Actinocatenispora sera TaxID=390989 RepID=UPI0033DBC8D4